MQRRTWMMTLGLGLLPTVLACSDDDSAAEDGGSGSTTASTTMQGSTGAVTTVNPSGTGTGSASTGTVDSTGAAETSASSDSTGGPGTTGSTGAGSGSGSGSGESTGGFEVEGCGMCNAGEVCRANVAMQVQYECVAIPEACADQADCECATSLCEAPFVACSEPVQANSIECICIAC